MSPSTWAALLADVTDIRILLDCAGAGAVLLFDDFTLVGAPAGLFAPQPYVTLYDEVPGDNVIRRTSSSPSPVNPDAHIDLLQYRIGNYAPTDPNVSLFDGQVGDPAGYYFRLDLRFDGLVNPCGPVKRDCDAEAWVAYDPFLYGPNPLLGCIQFNPDCNVNTGGTGVTDWNPYKYLANASRLGFRAYSVGGGEYSQRTAQNYPDSSTEDFFHAPQTRWSGPEFEFQFGTAVEIGYPEEYADKLAGDGDDLFEAGEKWVMHGHYLNREPIDTGGSGIYCPAGTQVQFAHNLGSDHTTVTLVFPIYQEADPDFDAQNEVSAYEILWQFKQQNQCGDDPECSSIFDGWLHQEVEDYLMSHLWEMRILAATCCTTAPPEGQPFVWTEQAYARPSDTIPLGAPGDFNGDGTVDAADSALLFQFIAAHDGDPFWDSDGNPNDGSLTIPADPPYYDGFPMNFCLYDLNYDGIVNAADDPLAPGPLADLDADLDRDAADFSLFALAMGGPKVTAPPAGCGLGLFGRSDFDADADVDLIDFARFQVAFSSSK